MRAYALCLLGISLLFCATLIAGVPPLKDLLVLMDPADTPPADVGLYHWKDCIDPSHDYQPVLKVGGKLARFCRPDTLYTWGGVPKLEEYQKNAPKGGAWASRFTRPIFAHINPASTFAYGPIAIRMKLKPDTKYYLDDSNTTSADTGYCARLLSPSQWQNTIIIRYWKHSEWSGTDYVLCSPGPIESWSYDTPRHYDELVNSLQYSYQHKTYDGWLPYGRTNGTPQLFDTGLDSHDWSRAYLRHNLANMRNRIETHAGEIVFAPGVPNDPARHYATERPIYWNWNRPDVVAAVKPPPDPPPVHVDPVPVVVRKRDLVDLESDAVFCKPTGAGDLYSPARKADGQILDDGAGVAKADCENQIAAVKGGLYCARAARGSGYGPKLIRTGEWRSDQPTSLGHCLGQIATVSQGAFCRREGDTRWYYPARTLDDAKLGENAASYYTCKRQLESARSGMLCAPHSAEANDYVPILIASQSWRGEKGTDLTSCSAQVSQATDSEFCKRRGKTEFYSKANIESGEFTDDSELSLEQCLNQLTGVDPGPVARVVPPDPGPHHEPDHAPDHKPPRHFNFTLVIHCPANAVILVNGQRTHSVGRLRKYVSTGLIENKNYHYIVTAKIPSGRDSKEETRSVKVNGWKDYEHELHFFGH